LDWHEPPPAGRPALTLGPLSTQRCRRPSLLLAARIGELDRDDTTALRSAFDSELGRAIAEDVNRLSQWSTVRSVVYELEDHL
jgi:hypothetical protein